MILTDDQLIKRAIRAYHQRGRGTKFDRARCDVARDDSGALVTIRSEAGVVVVYRYHASLNRLARVERRNPTPEECVRALLARIATATATA